MQNENVFDYIIVGQGLAGSCVSLQLIKMKKRILVIDLPSQNKSTTIAAGLFNPVTGKRQMVKTWLADTLFPYLKDFYEEAEALSGERFFFPTPLYRPFISVEEQNEWVGRTADHTYDSIIDSVSTSSRYQNVNDPFGGMLLKSCGYINTVAFMNAVRNLVTAHGSYRADNFDYTDLNISEDRVEYKGMVAAAILFCEGCGVSKNPWFCGVPVQPLKGETITIKSAWREQVLLNRGVYIVPSVKNSGFKVGATYNLKDKSEDITLEARHELESKLKDLLTMPFEVQDQEWGVRPTTADRRPILGKHPKFNNLMIFNGLGTKGVSLAPYFSKVLVQSMGSVTTTTHKEVAVTRFKLLY